MRYVEGTDLHELLRAEGTLEPARAVSLLAQVAGALDAAHEHGLVHRDVKPGNVLIATDNHVYLSDFGLTKQAASDSGVTETDQFVGSVDYVAPEQIERQAVDGRADVYSLACVLYECLAGEAPYRSDSLTGTLWAHITAPAPSAHAKRPELPSEIDEVIARGMAKEPDDRHGTCGELAQDAQAALGISGQLTAPPATPSRSRRRLLVSAALALAAIAAAVPVGLVLTRSNSDTPATRAPDTKPTLAITADSIQHIDPATNTLAGTTRIGGRINQVAIGEGAVWAAAGRADKLYRIAPETAAVTGHATTFGHPLDIAVGFGLVWVTVEGVSSYRAGTMNIVDPDALTTVMSDLTGEDNVIGPVETSAHNVWAGTTDPSGWLWWLYPPVTDFRGNVKAPPPNGVALMAAGNGLLWIASYTVTGSGEVVGQARSRQRVLSAVSQLNVARLPSKRTRRRG